MDKRHRRAKMNAVSTLANQLVATLCGILIPWVMIDTFGSEAYGATTSIAQFLSYISLLEGGIGRAARGELYKPLAEGDTQNISRVFLAVKRFFRTVGLAFLVYAVLLAFCYYDIANISIFTRDYIFWLVVAITIGKFAEYMGGYSNITLFNADQRQYVSNAVVIGTSILNVVLVIILSRSGCDLLWVKLGSSLVFLLKPFIYSVYRRRHYSIVPIGERAALKNRWTAIGQHIAYFVQCNIDIFILTVFANLKYVAVYSVYHLISFSLRNIVTSFGGGMEALFGDMLAKEENTELRTAYKRYKLILTVLTVTVYGAALILIVPFVKLYTAGVTDADYIQPAFGMILLLGDAVYCLTLPCYNLPIAANKLKESRTGAYGEAVINIVVSMCLVFWNPLVGIAIGTLASMIFKGIYLMIFSGANILRVKWGRMLVETAASVAVLIAIALLGMRIMAWQTVTNYFTWILWGFASVIATGCIALLLGWVLYRKQFEKVVVIFRKGKSR